MIESPEREGKLDTMTMRTTAAAQTADARVDVVNGSRGMLADWPSIDWRRVDDDVRRLRQRIFTASKAGDLAKVRNLSMPTQY